MREGWGKICGGFIGFKGEKFIICIMIREVKISDGLVDVSEG